MPPSEDRIDEARAALVWRRAAELQAEATQRMEERARRLAFRGDSADASTPGFHRSDVEAAAVEAGIAPEFVRLALSEMESGGGTAGGLAGWKDQAATRLLGTDRRSVELMRTVSAPPNVVFEAMQRVFPAHPYLLSLRDTIGDDPLDGGIMVFQVPSIYTSSGYTPFTYYMSVADVKQIRIAIRPLGGEGKVSSEIVASADLRGGVRLNWWIGASATGVLGRGGAALGAGVGATALGLGGALVALPALVGGALIGGATALGYGAAYRWGVRKAVNELDGLLRAVDVNARTRGAFAPPHLPRGSSGDGAIAASIAIT